MVSKTRLPSRPEARNVLIYITHMQDEVGNNKYDRQDFADVFADVYDELHTSTTKTHEREREREHEDKCQQHQDTKKPITM